MHRWILVQLIALLATAPGSAESVTFAFGPAVGGTFRLHEITTRAEQFGGRREELVILAEAQLRVAREADRFFILNRIEQAEARKNGTPIVHPLVEAVRGAEVVYVTGLDGVLDRVDGLRRIFDRMLPRLGGEERAALERRLALGGLDRRDRAAWYERIELLAGQTLELDHDYWFESAWPVEGVGWVGYQGLLRLGPWEGEGTARRLRVASAYVADAKATLPGATQLVPRVRSELSPALAEPRAEGYTFVGTASRRIDPTTLDVWREQAVRQIRHRVKVSEELAVWLLEEEKSDLTLLPAADGGPAIPNAKQEGKP